MDSPSPCGYNPPQGHLETTRAGFNDHEPTVTKCSGVYHGGAADAIHPWRFVDVARNAYRRLPRLDERAAVNVLLDP